MSDRLKGKRAFVTAAAAGIGRACAIAFAREGATVFATDIDESGIAALEQGRHRRSRQGSTFADTAAVDAFAKRVGKIDILLNAAGFVHHGTVLDCSDEDWDFSFDLNVKSMHRTIRRSCRACWRAAAAASSTSPLARRCKAAGQPLCLQRDQGGGCGC